MYRGWYKPQREWLQKDVAEEVEEAKEETQYVEYDVDFPTCGVCGEKLEVKDVAEMSAEQLCGLLRSGCGNVMGMETLGGCEVKGAEIRMARRRDFEWFLDDMMRISEVMKRRACERRVRLAGNRELTKLLEELNANGDMSILLSPLASESRKLQNAMENEESEGERSDGVLSVSEGERSEREEEERGKKQCCLENYGSGECVLTSEKLHNYSVL